MNARKATTWPHLITVGACLAVAGYSFKAALAIAGFCAFYWLLIGRRFQR